MDTPKHTPAPWTLETVPTSCGICHKVGPFSWKNGKQKHACIYVDYNGDGLIEKELEANARLIAAAPDLLEALQTLNLVIGLTPIAGNKDALQEACDIASAAIAKAEGRME